MVEVRKLSVEEKLRMTMLRTATWVSLLLTGVIPTAAHGQGDPQKMFDAAKASVRKPGTKVRIDLIGDSTQTDHAGYGRGFCANLTATVDCVNMAKGGASTKTFREQGLWDRSLATKPDYMLIQFGHNDQVTKEHLERQVPIAEYEANLRRYIDEARAAGIKPVLCTPLTRRYFEADGKIHSDLLDYSASMKKVASEMKVPLIDLQTDSIAYLDAQGEAKGSTLGITKKDVDGKTIPDKTHLNWAGSFVFGRIVAVDLGKAVPSLKKYVRSDAAKLPLEGMKAMAVFDGGPVKIVLVGDSTVATGGGWGPGFCAVMTPNVTCIDDALNGRSSKSFIDEGAWAKALAKKGDYYLIQFGHNDQKPDAARHTDVGTTFDANLKRYIADVRAIGGVPVLVTSLSRRTIKDGKVVEDLKEYAEATRKVGAEEYVTVIDLNKISTDMLNKMTQAEADRFNAVGQEQERTAVGKSTTDRTHLNPYGQKVFGRIVADQIVRTQVELGPDLIGEPAKATGQAAAMQAEWRFDRTDLVGGHSTKVLGHPVVIDTPRGKAVQFNGVDDALFVDVHPMAGAETWTWEMIFRPDADGNPEQRVFHLQSIDPATGEDVAEERMLFEIRIHDGQWCLDSFATSGGQRLPLLDCTPAKLHKFGPWYRVTAVYDGKTLKNYVGDELQGEGEVKLTPQRPGHSSIGTRINLRDYYKGGMYAARFTRRALPVEEFMKLPAGN
jgi:lysophospholipase L1-like esterase